MTGNSIFFSSTHLKGETSYVTYLKWERSIVEKNFRIYLIPIKHFYSVHFLNKSVKSFVIFHQLFRPAGEMFFLQFLNKMEKTWNKYYSTN